MKHRMITTAVLVFMAVPALASSSRGLTDEIRAQIKETLTNQGYEVVSIKMEDGLYEAYARKDGQRLEVYLDKEFNIQFTKRDD